MLTLRSAPASPYGRKVKICAALLGLSDQMRIVEADTTNPEDTLRKENPLGKIPVLILEDGATVYDSRVIVDYLDHMAGGGKMVPRGARRFDVLRLQALTDGLCDAALMQVYESRWRSEDKRDAKWLEHQAGKIERALAALEAAPPKLTRQLHVGHVMTACALGYLDLRFAGAWRKKHPKLRKWLAKFEERVPAFEATRVKG
ncbi:MAG: glutathione S-transferase family protein [Bosea sp.]|jgi:glutathione S-transferase|nr:glutathione S-transferase family protein [Bosea sp. (in: a-proteobacteria)]